MSRIECDDLHPGNTTTVKLFNVKVDGELRNDAIVTVTVKDATEAVVSGGSAIIDAGHIDAPSPLLHTADRGIQSSRRDDGAGRG